MLIYVLCAAKVKRRSAGICLNAPASGWSGIILQFYRLFSGNVIQQWQGAAVITWQREKVPSKPRRAKSLLAMALALVLAEAEGAGYFFDSLPVHSVTAMLPGTGCRSRATSLLIPVNAFYHLPGQRYCDPTRISFQDGERWFYSEAETRQAGWRKARQ